MRTRYLESDEVEKIERRLTLDEWLPLWVTLETGMRVGDVVALQRDNVSDGAITFTARKTHKTSTVPISKRLADILLRGTSKWIFPSPRDARRHLTRQAVWHRVKRAARSAGVELCGAAPHSFRKVFAVEYFREHGLLAVQGALQHERTDTTQIYALSDFTSGANGSQPLLRRDLPLIIREVVLALRRENATAL